jgi:hypothetical protein
MVPVDQMAAYISAQVDAMRSFSATTGQPRDHWGFAWAPSNTTGLSTADFAAQTGQLLDRLAASIRDSAEATDPETGTGACGPPGADTLCNVDIDGASHNGAWRSFRTWTQPLLTIAPPTETVAAGAPSAPSTVSLTTAAGTPATTGPSLAVTLRSSSSRGTFGTSSAGPWTPTLTLSVAPGVAGTFYYRDTLAGSFTVTASATGATAGTQAVTVTAGPPARVALESGPIGVPVRASRPFSATVRDAFGNPLTATITWSVTPRALGSIAAKGNAATFTAGRILGAGTVTAAAGPTIAARAPVRVLPARMRVRLLTTKVTARGILATVSTVDGSGRPVSRSRLRVVAEGTGRHLSAGGTTGAAGKARVALAVGPGCYTVSVTRARSQGFVWDGHAPTRRVCR